MICQLNMFDVNKRQYLNSTQWTEILLVMR